MYAVILQWKEFNLNVAALDAYLRANAGEFYTGCSADYHFTGWFTEDPGPTIVTMCNQYWDGLDEESDEATTYITASAISAAIEALRLTLYTKEWSDMSVAERKILTGQTPTRAELGL